MSEGQGSFKNHAVTGIIVALVVCIVVYILGLLKVHALWPAFFVMIFFFVTGANMKNLVNIMAGAVFGLIMAYGMVVAVVTLTPSVGPTWATLIPLAVALFIMVGFTEALPWICNNFAIGYFTIALINPTQMDLVTWGIVAILGGGAAVLGIVYGITLAVKAGLMSPPQH